MFKKYVFVLMLLATMALAAACGSSGMTGGTQDETAGQEQTTTSRASTTTKGETFTRDNWATLASDPDAHKNSRVDIVGQVFIAPERDDDGTYWQMWCDPVNSEWNTLVGYGDPSFQVSDGDYVHVVGTVKGSYEGENLMGGKIVAVAIIADSAEVVDAMAAAPSAKRTVSLDASQDQHGLVVTVEKVEYASSETRVFVTVRNGSGKSASFYSFNAKAVQGENQFDAEYSSVYPEVQSELLPDVSSSGVVLFPKMDPAKETKIYLEGQSGDYSLDFDAYVFTVPAE